MYVHEIIKGISVPINLLFQLYTWYMSLQSTFHIKTHFDFLNFLTYLKQKINIEKKYAQLREGMKLLKASLCC